jgi:hypothetical protein
LAERDFVKAQLDHLPTICGICDATLRTYSDVCAADLSDECPGFKLIERAKAQFKEARNAR